MSGIRTRFAPSPTGWMHIGNLRTAIYAYLFARANDGTFILRLEDTDQKRYVEGAADFVYDTLEMIGIKWDEGPNIGGDYGPYIQSDRKDIYAEYAHKLVEHDGGYYCFCGEEVKRERGEIDPCRDLDKEEAKARVDSGEKFVVRQKIPVGKKIEYYDQVYGKIIFDTSDLDEGVMLKSDGLPTYNFANVIDDHLMEISHVMRGNEYLSSTPKYQLLYEAFGWNSPKYIHLTMIMKDKNHKLSKRDGSASFMDLIKRGYLPEAVVNYVVLSGWHPKDDRELFTLQELTKVFGVKGLQKSPALFDQAKLDWMNGQYLMKLSDEEFHSRAMEFYPDDIKEKCDVEYLSKILKKRVNFLGQIPEVTKFFVEMPAFSNALYLHEKMKTTLEGSKEAIENTIPKLEALSDWNEESIKGAMFSVVSEVGVKTGQVLWPLRVALSGQQFTPGGAVEIAVVIGKGETMRRLKSAVEKI